MKYLVHYFYRWYHKTWWKQYKNIKEACIEEDKLMKSKRKIKWILIESKRTWRILFHVENMIDDNKNIL